MLTYFLQSKRTMNWKHCNLIFHSRNTSLKNDKNRRPCHLPLFNHFNSFANDAGQTRLMMALHQDKKKLAQMIAAVSFKMSRKERFSCTLLFYARCFKSAAFWWWKCGAKFVREKHTS